MKEADSFGILYSKGKSVSSNYRDLVKKLYYGKEPWDGAMNLHEIMDWSEIPEEFRGVVPDYPVYVLDFSHFEHAEEFQTDVKLVCSFLKYSSNMEKLKSVVEEYRDEFSNLAEETYDVISALSHTKQLDVIKDVCKTERGEVNMCKAIDDMIREGEEVGKVVGRQEGIALTKLVIRLDNQGMSTEEIAKQCEISFTEVQEILS